ncbi:PIN domain protein [archaeon BMS3Abin17]|nr:PIN domain protein [archaeon BMS3Abin17]HDZ60808.1 type II toxin-antitoxin system VapC family toxin [Candidatus Pacearchaeota archaeon]
MTKLFYLDTSIWLDFLEDRNEPNMPKSDWAKKFIENIILYDDKIIISDVVINELIALGYSEYDLEEIFLGFDEIIIRKNSLKKQVGKAKDLSKKREVPLLDALHAVIARDNNALLITFDNHFKQLTDIVKTSTSKEFI